MTEPKAPAIPDDSVFAYSEEQLTKIIQTDTFPEGMSYVGLDKHSAKDLLYKHRYSPALFAKTILKSRATSEYKMGTRSKKEYLGSIPLHLRQERHEMEKEKIEIQKGKLHNQTQMAQEIEKIHVRIKKIDGNIALIYRLLHSALKGGKTPTQEDSL